MAVACNFPQYSQNDMDAALCIWEYALHCKVINDETVYDWLRGDEGAAAARDMCIDLASDLDTSYHVATSLGYDDSFDWEFVPAWVRLAMDIPLRLGTSIDWLDYMGRTIYRDRQDAM